MFGPTGTPFSNLQPALAVTRVILGAGIYPTSGPQGDTLGFIYNFAGNFAPGSSYLLNGQLLSIDANPELFDLIGSTYGGDGYTDFALPDLQGVVTIGAGNAAGLATEVGQTIGSTTVALTATQLPPPLPGAGGQPFYNVSPSLSVTPVIQVTGIFPSSDSGSASSSFIGQIADFAGNSIPNGWMAADGALLQIAQYTALFLIVGTTYGGDGKTTFALPDLTNRVAVGAGASDILGTQFGQAVTTVTEAELPTGLVTGGTATDQPITNDQPSLAVNYLIATTGGIPSRDGGAGFDASSPTIGQIVAFAGTFAPAGWALCDGQLLSIVQNTALFSILGTQYGGDGKTTFALPDLEGRTLVGTGTSATGATYWTGDVVGSDQTQLTLANLPTADQTPVPCFLPGTLILTPSGEREVETLVPGDLVRTFGGAVRPIVWIGTGRTLSIRGRRSAATPVIVHKGAFAPNVPHEDLHVTKGHSFYLDGVLIPAEFLVNHQSILWDDRSQEVTVYHLELETHDVLVANGAPAESYRDDGNRYLFRNASPNWALPPKPPCAPVMTDGSVVDAVWRRLLDRTGPRPPLSSTDDPDLHLLVDGRSVAASARTAAWWVFPLPATAKQVRLVSRAAVPQELGTARDPRRLGVAVRRILVRKGTGCRSVEAADPSLEAGFHAFEADIGIRWTNGDAAVPACLLGRLEQGAELLVCLGGDTVYETDASGRLAA